MIGQKMSYKKYLESLVNTPDPNSISFERLHIDYKGLIAYARSKGVLPCDLSVKEKESFIIR